jgi:hypothetical protein
MNDSNSLQPSGFLVVRLPFLNKDALGRGAYSKIAPSLGSIYYGGIDRMDWFDVEEDFYNNTLPDSIDK